MREQFKKFMLVGSAIVLSFFTSNFMPVMTAYATTSSETEIETEVVIQENQAEQSERRGPKPPILKDWVCKYVGTPGINERLKTGGEGLVWVNASATEGSYFKDGHNRSYVLKANAPHDPKPNVSECPVPQVTVTQYMTVVWKVVDSDGNGNDWEQEIVDNIMTSTPNLGALDHLLVNTVCNRYQVDVYHYTTAGDKAKVDTLIAGGVLYGPNNPPEPLISGGAGVAYKLVGTNGTCPLTVTPCVEPLGSMELAKDDFIAALSDTRATGHYKFTADGLHIWTEGATSTDKVAEYWTINKDLEQIGIPSIDYTNTAGGVPGLQLVIDFDNNGSADGILVGESIYGNNWWLNNASALFVQNNAPHTGGGNGSPWYGTLDEWLTKFPNAKVVAGGFSLGSGVKGDGVIKSVTIGCVTYTFKYVAPPQPVICTTWNTIHSTNLNQNGWTLSAGATYVEGGMNLSVPGAWAESTITRPLSGALADLGTGITFTPGTQYLGLHVETSIGTLVYEQEPTYGGNWWSWDDFNVGPGMGYPTYGSLEEIVAANPDVTLVSLTVLYTSPTAANTTVTSVKIGCVEYTFDKETVPGEVLGDSTTKTPPTGQVLSTSTTIPSVLPATGPVDSAINFVYAILAAIAAYGATYFLQGKRRFEQ